MPRKVIMRKSIIEPSKPNANSDLKLQRELQETRDMLAAAQNENMQLRNKINVSITNNYETEKFDFTELFPGNYQYGNSPWSAYTGDEVQHSSGANNTAPIEYPYSTDLDETDRADPISGGWVEETSRCSPRSDLEGAEKDRSNGALIERDSQY